jgi:succinate dehydrogenase/fumarate reductase cytochrome b subunit
MTDKDKKSGGFLTEIFNTKIGNMFLSFVPLPIFYIAYKGLLDTYKDVFNKNYLLEIFMIVIMCLFYISLYAIRKLIISNKKLIENQNDEKNMIVELKSFDLGEKQKDTCSKDKTSEDTSKDHA